MTVRAAGTTARKGSRTPLICGSRLWDPSVGSRAGDTSERKEAAFRAFGMSVGERLTASKGEHTYRSPATVSGQAMKRRRAAKCVVADPRAWPPTGVTSQQSRATP